MGEDKFPEEAVLAAVKPLKTTNLAPPQSEEGGTSRRDPSFRLTMVNGNTTESENARAMEMAKGATEVSGLESLFREHHDRVFRTAHRVTGSAADAEDVLQTVFLRLARTKDSSQAPDALKTFDWSENPEAYLSRAAINASLDLLRKRKRARVVAMDDVENGVAMKTSATRRTPESHQEDRELRRLIREAVARLGEKAGAMFALRYFEGYDNGEIARLMDTSALVVGVTLHRARTRLRKEIGRYLGTHSEKGDLSA